MTAHPACLAAIVNDVVPAAAVAVAVAVHHQIVFRSHFLSIARCDHGEEHHASERAPYGQRCRDAAGGPPTTAHVTTACLLVVYSGLYTANEAAWTTPRHRDIIRNALAAPMAIFVCESIAIADAYRPLLQIVLPRKSSGS